MILEEEFVVLYDEYSSKNPQFCEVCGRSSERLYIRCQCHCAKIVRVE